jgi:NAD(P)-dependent dehydrogenase (short-subunit alcohol dehydrogenase family)
VSTKKSLAGKVAVVTGSTQGLGAAIAALYVIEGAKVVLTGLSSADGNALAKKLGRNSIFEQTDLSRVDDCRRLIEVALKRFGKIDILVNNAVDATRATVDDVSPDVFDRIFAVNVRAPLLLAHHAIASLRRQSGVIINIGSINAFMGEPSLLVYAASKAALQTASRNLANYLKFDRVRVYCLNIGWMNSEGERTMMKQLGHPPDFLERQGQAWPLGRILKPAEVAEVALFVASGKAAPFSGQVIELEQFPTGALGVPKKGGLT